MNDRSFYLFFVFWQVKKQKT
ncbi:hypothetical protein CGSHiR3021_11394 [Haemophilus influenzae 22.4-21]|uniref:Uncharacterized protein n=1 Tax=Haemophilus influenzae 22.4-21 TaxID=375063 RepID=A4NZY5_HAEIF|nr:hypothetical protein CGSHiR3021_11394 [Haemophilus influenzae 22.4-21]